MKTAMYLALSTTLMVSTLAYADPKPADSRSFKDSIIAFGVAPDAASQAASQAIKEIERLKVESENRDNTDHFATISDELINNPYGF